MQNKAFQGSCWKPVSGQEAASNSLGWWPAHSRGPLPSDGGGDGFGCSQTASSVGCVCLSQDGSLQCPSCKTIYGEKTGTQPQGKMEVLRFQMSLPGHKDCGPILIVYSIPHGIQVRGLLESPTPGHSSSHPTHVPAVCPWIKAEDAHVAKLRPPGPLRPGPWRAGNGEAVPGLRASS